MNAEILSPVSARDLEPGNLPEPPDPIVANPLRLLHRDAWCQPEDLLFEPEKPEPEATEESIETAEAEMRECARYAICAPEELALALCFATEELLPAGTAREGAEKSILQANNQLLEATEAAAGSLRKARLLTEAIEAWDGYKISGDHLHAMNTAVYEMTGLAVNERRLRERIDMVLGELVAQFMEEIPAELAMRHILFLKTCEDTHHLPLFELDNFPFYRPMAGHIRSLADFLRLSTWLLESPRFVNHGPENPEEVEALMSTTQDCRDDLEFWADQESYPRPGENLQREIRTRITLLALVVALRSRMWQDATQLITGFTMQDLRDEKDEAGRQTLQFTLEIVPLIARHQIEPQKDLENQLAEAGARLSEVRELIDQVREIFCETESPEYFPPVEEPEKILPPRESEATPRPRAVSLHAIPETPLPGIPAQAPARQSDRRSERRKVVAQFVQNTSQKEAAEGKQEEQTRLHKIRPRKIAVEGDGVKDVETEERRRLLGKRVADFERNAGSGNRRKPRRGAGRIFGNLKNRDLMALSAAVTLLLALTGGGFFLMQVSKDKAAPEPVLAEAGVLAPASSGSREIDLTASDSDHRQPVELLSGYQTRGGEDASPRQGGPTMDPEDFQVKKIIYFSEDGHAGEVKAAHINDWVYREGEELVDFSTGARVAFQVVKIERSQVILRNKVQELQLPLVSR